MSDRLPDRLFPRKYADKSAKIEGCWPVDECVRLPELVEKLTGIELELQFVRQTSGRIVIDGRLKTELQLICQRCLRSLAWPLDVPLHLAVCGNERDFATLPAGYEPLEVDEDGGITTRQFVEDEVIIRLPAAPAHADISQCDPDMLHRSKEFDVSSRADESGGKKQNPFAVLKKRASKN
ncbi:MAG TPA: YceD family protein [Gammaproteobacteria bacterium]|jgi:uncharacterized protein